MKCKKHLERQKEMHAAIVIKLFRFMQKVNSFMSTTGISTCLLTHSNPVFAPASRNLKLIQVIKSKICVY